MSTTDPVKRRNYQVVGIAGGFILPLAGLVAAGMFWVNEDRDIAVSTAVASIAGAIFYLVIFAA